MKTYTEKQFKDALIDMSELSYWDGFKHGVSTALNALEPNHFDVVEAWKNGKEIPTMPKGELAMKAKVHIKSEHPEGQ